MITPGDTVTFLRGAGHSIAAAGASAVLVMGFPVKKVDPDLAVLFRPSVHNYLISWFRINPGEEIAKLKMPDLTASDLDAAVRTGR